MISRGRTWNATVMQVLNRHYPKAVDLKTIYSEVARYRKLTEWDLEETSWNETRYENTVRRAMTDLVRMGYAERIGKGVYVGREKNE